MSIIRGLFLVAVVSLRNLHLEGFSDGGRPRILREVRKITCFLMKVIPCTLTVLSSHFREASMRLSVSVERCGNKRRRFFIPSDFRLAHRCDKQSSSQCRSSLFAQDLKSVKESIKNVCRVVSNEARHRASSNPNHRERSLVSARRNVRCLELFRSGDKANNRCRICILQTDGRDWQLLFSFCLAFNIGLKWPSS
jgi:hypothetical protein